MKEDRETSSPEDEDGQKRKAHDSEDDDEQREISSPEEEYEQREKLT